MNTGRSAREQGRKNTQKIGKGKNLEREIPSHWNRPPTGGSRRGHLRREKTRRKHTI